MRSKWLLTGGLAAVALTAALLVTNHLGPWRAKPAPPAVRKAPAAPNEISLQGRIEAKTVLNIPAPADGIIDRFMANVGEDVFEGELLAEIKNGKLDSTAQNAEADAARAQARAADAEAALNAARLEASRSRADAIRTKSDFERAEKVYERQKLLVAEGATPRLVFEKAEAEYNKLKADSESFNQIATAAEDRVTALTKEVESARKMAEAKAQDVSEAKADLGAGEVRSAVNGIVVGRHGQAGEPVSRGVKDLFRIGVDLGTLQVVAPVDPALLSRIRPGQGAQIQIAEAPGAIIGTVREVKAAQVFVEFASPSTSIRPGLTAQVRVPLS